MAQDSVRHRTPFRKGRRGTLSTFARRTLEVVLILGLVYLLWKTATALLLGFAGVLLGILLDRMTGAVMRPTGLSRRWALTVVCLGIVALFAAAVWFVGPMVAGQFRELGTKLPETIGELRGRLQQYEWGRTLLGFLAAPAAGEGDALSRLTGFATTAVDVLASLLLVLFVGIFLALDPGLYRRGILHLVPIARRARAREVLDAMNVALWRWLLGRFIAFLFVSATTSVTLWLIGVPLALVLGLIAGLMDIVPFVGPLVGAVPGILLGFTDSLSRGLYTMLAYAGIQLIQNNFAEPVIEHRVVSLPPALTLMALTVFGLLFGLLGVLLAVPLAVVTLVLVQMLYVQDTLGDDIALPGEKQT